MSPVDENLDPTINRAIIFIKPLHSGNIKVEDFVKNHLASFHIQIDKEHIITGDVIKRLGLIDKHYGVIAERAMETTANELWDNMTEDKQNQFLEMFGKTMLELSLEGRFCNLKEYLERFPDETNGTVHQQWRDADLLKVGSGTYVALLEKNNMIVVNGFYGTLREKYIVNELKMRLMEVSFDSKTMNWKSFRDDVIGATDPSKAKKGSLRNLLMDEFKALGAEEPDMQNNGVHASASPLEALKERSIWLRKDIKNDIYFKILRTKNVPINVIMGLVENKPVTFEGKTEKAFDLFENKDTAETLTIASAVTLVV